MALARLHGVVLDCPDPRTLAEFYRRIGGGEIVYDSAEFVFLACAPVGLGFQRAPEASPPDWPEPTAPMRAHVDFEVGDPARLDEMTEQAVALGARRASSQPRPASWRVLLDPVGHPFCLTAITG